MPTYVFVPLSDELLFNCPEKITGPLVPYNPSSVIGSLDPAAMVYHPTQSSRLATWDAQILKSPKPDTAP
jgi:hypothetical protein